MLVLNVVGTLAYCLIKEDRIWDIWCCMKINTMAIFGNMGCIRCDSMGNSGMGGRCIGVSGSIARLRVLGVGWFSGLSRLIRVRCRRHGLGLSTYSVRLRGLQAFFICFLRQGSLPSFRLVQPLSYAYFRLCLCAIEIGLSASSSAQSSCPHIQDELEHRSQ